MCKSFRLMLLLLPLAGCQSVGSDMRATAPAVPALAFAPVQGPDGATARKFEGILAEEAKRKGYSLGSGLQVKTFLDSYATDGNTGYSWVIDASPDGQRRAARVKGGAVLGASAAPWSNFDEAAMRQVARMSIEDLTRQLQASGVSQDEPGSD